MPKISGCTSSYQETLLLKLCVLMPKMTNEPEIIYDAKSHINLSVGDILSLYLNC